MSNQIVKKPSGFLGKIVALLIGLILGIIAGIGGLAAGGYIIFTKVKIKDEVDTINGFIDPDLNTLDIVTEEYAEKTLFDAFGAIIAASQELSAGTGTLQSLADVSPLVAKAVETLVAGADEMGLKLETEALLSTPMNGMQAYLVEKIGDMEIRALVENFAPDMDQNDPIMQAILYGVKGVAYDVNEDNTIEMLPYYYRYKSNNDTFLDETDKIFSFDETNYAAEDGTYIIPYTGEDEAYDFELYNAEGVLVYQLRATALDPTVFGAFVNGELVLHKPNILRPLLSGRDGFSDLLKPVYVGDFFGVTPNSDEVLIALSYGELNKNYYIDAEKNKIVPITTPTKLGDLTDGNIEEVFAKITLDSVVDIDLNNGLMLAIAYGKSSHYEIVETNGERTVKMLPVRYTLVEGVLTDDDGEAVENATLVNGVYVITNGDKTSYAVYNDAEGCYFEYTTKDFYTDETIVNYPKTTVMDMKGGLDSAINEVTIADLVSGITEDNILLWSIKGWRITDLKNQDKILALKLYQVMDIPEDGSPLDLLRNAKIGNLSKEINNIKLLDFIAEDEGVIYALKLNDDGNPVNANGEVIYYDGVSKTFYTTSTFEAGTEAEAVYVDENNNDLEYNAADKTWYIKGSTTPSKRVLTGSWYYMFTDPEGNTSPEDYSVHDVHALVANMNANIKKATIGDLAAHGIIEVSDATLNSATTRRNGAGEWESVLIKDLYVSEALDLLATLGNASQGNA